MITKINKLKNFGIFQNFAWNGLDNFKKKNLIYGWNYSGKTTLSKLFQNLEFKDKNKYFSDSEFDISIEKVNVTSNFNQNDLERFPFYIKVFNTEYIKRIFTWDTPSSGINPISFYLGDPSGILDKKIKKLIDYTQILATRRELLRKKYIVEFENYNKANGKFTFKAKEIRENYLDNQLNQTQLNKTSIQSITDKVKIDLTKHILSKTERDKIKKEAISINNFEPQTESFSFSENLEALSEKVKMILENTAPKSISFPDLDENTALFDWVQTGIKFHEDETVCKFCTKTLPTDRINNLNTFYSKKLQEIQSLIISTKEKIKLEREKLNINFPNKNVLGISFQNEFIKAVNDFNLTAKKYDDQLTILEKDLNGKTADYFNNMKVSKIEIITFKDDFEKIEKLFKGHNLWLTEFDKNKKKALDKILNHYVAEFLLTEDYNKKEADNNRATEIISKIELIIINNEINKLDFEAKLKSTVRGKKELNTILEILIHRNDIKIEILNDKFTLERSGHPANNLSEGEKSAIAFAYFLTELKSLRNDEPPKLPNTIVFIDDPISSLDSNHIFQVRSLLQHFFNTEIEDYLQLFISTHNFEFFSVMYDSGIFSRNQKEVNRPLYFIKRNKLTSSTIEKLPKMFSKHKSEYVGLFHIIKEFNDLENKDDFPHLLILPNALRRFLELYTLMKYPTELDVDKRVSEVFNPNDKPYYGTKLLHWFSHQNQFEKIQQHDDKILQVEDAIKDLMEYIENKDELHWKGLNEVN